MREDQDLVPVATFDTLSEAEIAKGLLESEGIEAVLQDRPLASLLPPVAFANGGLALLVAQDELANARDVLATPDRTGPGEGEPDLAAAPPVVRGDGAV
jgi:hypothetical protein